MTDIVITEFMDEAAVEALRARYDVHHDPDLFAKPDELERLLADVPALIVRNQTQVRGAVLDAAKNLKVVGRLGVGLDNIDMAACAARDIRVFPATGANSLSVVEYVIGTAMTLLRGAYFANAAMLAGTFPKTKLIGREIAGKRMGLVGFGAIARDVAHHARALGMTIAAYDPYVPADDPAWNQVERLELDGVLSSSDVISLHLPLTDETRGVIGKAAFAQMKPDAILVNAARGGVMDEAELVAALKAGRLGGAALDVFAQEPLGKDAAQLFAGTPNLILTPHIAGNTVESNGRVSGLVAERVMAALEDRL
ncbi:MULTISPECIES: hydroxyacid dehydrogenase [unclassified Bosea (in: a-proteobacteria)]|uniref:hydroxyacid dehydrogenase n=1 Tax=unclassified Bosea (in: a-proteobacteria) TaxID=2653178 RepID=UPI00095467A4|nr:MULTISPECIES: hydroxyacid dehydrogenase [unclassified Bosea (in: a-proteobacteria)]TAJ30213.1 MAG: hydroxyacid dehydrogenase [Bosea sp. (in: a-proteobacteria)]SIP91484.1 (S)-sulfolactate dehydrogenase [Bosea sp. TND4EK4]